MASYYVHIPFCEHKCIYCDFYSLTDRGEIDTYLSALEREIRAYSDFPDEDNLETIYIGGGTPSMLEPGQIGRIIDRLDNCYAIISGAEITMEANPGTLSKEKLEGYRSAGVNRLSIGVQSFNDGELRFLTRIHSSGDVARTIKLARECGFSNLSIDLIYALPGQAISDWRLTLLKAVSYELEHISAYSLIVEQDTPLASKVSAVMFPRSQMDKEAEMYEVTMELLQKAGYTHYEVSNYAKPGYLSKHNSNYWNHSNYIGFGPSAHSFWERRRWWNTRDLDDYRRKLSVGERPLAGEEILTDRQLFTEKIMMGLRTGALDFYNLKMEFGIDLLSRFRPVVADLVRGKMAILEGNILLLTDKGFLVCDEIVLRFLADNR